MFKRIIFGAVTVLLTAFAQGVNTANAEIGDPELVTSFVWDRIESIRERDSRIGAASDLTSSLQIGIAWDARDVYPGHNIAVSVTITSGVTPASDLPKSFDLDLEIKLYQADMDQLAQSSLILVPTYTKTLTDGLKSGVTTQFPAFRAPAEGSYRLKTTLMITPEGQIPIKKTEERTFIVRSALPPGLAQLFSGLALFAAVMAIMAAGTEVIIESIKLAVGLKQKPTAMEAFMQLKAELPGQMANLGLNEGRWASNGALSAFFDSMRKQLEVTFRSHGSPTTAREALGRGNLGTLIIGLVELSKEKPIISADLSGRTRDACTELLSYVKTLLTFNIDEKMELKVQVDEAIKNAKADLLQRAAETIDVSLIGIQNAIPEWISSWLKSQIPIYYEEGALAVIARIDGLIAPMLEHLGFDPSLATHVSNELKRQVGGTWHPMLGNVGSYVEATQKLLKEVEITRDNVQSPLRKLGKWMGESTVKQTLGLVGVIVAIGATWTLVPAGDPSKDPMDFPVAVLACVWLFVFSLYMEIKAKQLEDRKDAKTDETSQESWLKKHCRNLRKCAREARTMDWSKVLALPLAPIGVYIMFFVATRTLLQQYVLASGASWSAAVGTVLWSLAMLLGRESPTPVSIVRPTEVAATLLQREEKHQDEETSRIRIMRVISIIVGCILAYAVEIDAIEILGQALPGIQVANPILGSVNQRVLGLVPLQHNLTAGMLLSGLAASAGSKFWRDFLGRLEAGKQQAEEAAIAIRRAKRALGQDEAQ